jgi:hypothetical protein
LASAARRRPAPAVEVLSPRALNRALLARQHLLSPARLAAPQAVEHLVGLQAQAPLAPYVGLFTRVEGFEAAELAELMRSRQVLRTHVMRGTIHLVTARDGLVLRALMQPALERSVRRTLVRGLSDDRLAIVTASARRALAEHTLTRPQVIAALSAEHPAEEAGAVAAAVGALVPTVQATPRGVWGETGAAAWTALERWTGRALPARAPDPGPILLRYLAAFGPASIADMRKWSGLGGLREVVERLRPRLRTCRDEQGAELFDVPDGPLPDPRTPAPPRFLPEYDNVLFAHENRARINPMDHAIPLLPGNGAAAGTVLLDGVYDGTWRIERAAERAILRIQPFGALRSREREALEAEGSRLLAFAAPEAGGRSVETLTPATAPR